VVGKSSDSGVSLAEVLAAYSLAIDLGLGQPFEHVMRAWRIAARLGRHAGVPDADQPELFHVAMLAWVGCVADAPEVAAGFGDDIAFRADSYTADLGGISGMAFFLSHAGSAGGPSARTRAVARMLMTGGNNVMQGIQGHCLTTSVLSDDLGLGDSVGSALRQFFARWDGKGVPAGVGGTQIALPVRLFHIGDVAEVHNRLGGSTAARKVILARRGKQFDPELADLFCQVADEVLAPEETDAAGLINAEPALRHSLSDAALDSALAALADFTDLRSTYRGGHSRGVADLVAAAASQLGIEDVTALHRAALVHDIGLHGVPATILDKSTDLSATEWERVRASSYYTERVLSRTPTLARIGAVASLVHERMDGSGFHRGVSGSGIAMPGRVLAAACHFRSMIEPRAHRDAVTVKDAATALRAEARAGRLDAEVVDAVLVAAGAAGRRRTVGPAGLTTREVEVLRLIARGATTREVAKALGIGQSTAGTHIERIYTKTGASSRSTATLFALRHGLLDPLD
jgi:HD-GYP domain-containing protein (c-di-GMP phosphodiesterase class II)/DNA-binding CsgD family transcriptional regulator